MTTIIQHELMVLHSNSFVYWDSPQHKNYNNGLLFKLLKVTSKAHNIKRDANKSVWMLMTNGMVQQDGCGVGNALGLI